MNWAKPFRESRDCPPSCLPARRLESWPARLYPLNTGGMPVVAALPAGIVTYESMMLLAVLFTLAGMLLEGRLLRRRRKEYEEYADSIVDGEIHIFARVASEEESDDLRLAVETGLCGSET